MSLLNLSLFQPQHLSPELIRAIEIIHSEDPLSSEDMELIRALRDELRDHVTVEARVVLEFVESNGSQRSPTDRSHPLPPRVALEDAAAGTSRPATDWSHPLPRQAEAEASMKKIEEAYLCIMNELDRIGKTHKKKNN